MMLGLSMRGDTLYITMWAPSHWALIQTTARGQFSFGKHTFLCLFQIHVFTGIWHDKISWFILSNINFKNFDIYAKKWRWLAEGQVSTKYLSQDVRTFSTFNLPESYLLKMATTSKWPNQTKIMAVTQSSQLKLWYKDRKLFLTCNLNEGFYVLKLLDILPSAFKQ